MYWGDTNKKIPPGGFPGDEAFRENASFGKFGGTQAIRTTKVVGEIRGDTPQTLLRNPLFQDEI